MEENGMNNGRRIGAFVVAAAAAMSMATVGVASPASAAGWGPQPTSTWLQAVRANTGTWVNIGWRTDRRICDVEVRVDGGRRVDVGYPGFRNYTSFSRGDSLSAGRTDYTAIRVTPRYDRSGVAQLRATIQYDNCGWHSRTQYRSSWLSLPVLRNNWPGNGGPGGPGNGGPGGPGNGGPGGPGNGGPGGPGNGGPGGPGNGGPGNGGPGGPGNGGPGGPGNGGPGNGGPGSGSHGNH
jgi:hypothetical protein